MWWHNMLSVQQVCREFNTKDNTKGKVQSEHFKEEVRRWHAAACLRHAWGGKVNAV